MTTRAKALLFALPLLASTLALADVPNLWLEAGAQHPQKGKGVTEVLAWMDGNVHGPVGYFVFAYLVGPANLCHPA